MGSAMSWSMYLGAAVGLTAGNFIFQAFDGHDWSLAIDRSLFQVAAVAVCAFGAWWQS